MSNFVLDYSKKQTLQISNDAFCFLYYGEEPLDEDNLEEANEVSEMFSNNFYICVLSVFSITSILVGDFISRQHQYDKDYLHHLYGDI